MQDREGNRLTFKYHAALDLHPYFEQLIHANEEELLGEATKEGTSVDVTQRFKEEAERLYRQNHGEPRDSQ